MADTPMADAHTQNAEYVAQLPRLPRVNLFPPAGVDLKEELLKAFNPPAPHPFMDSIRWKQVFTIREEGSWQYQERLAAQRILPWLFLGPVIAANCKSFLRVNQITKIISIRQQRASSPATEWSTEYRGIGRAEELGIPVQ